MAAYVLFVRFSWIRHTVRYALEEQSMNMKTIAMLIGGSWL